MDGGSDKKKIEELKRLLAEEKQASKKAIGKLQRELQRYRSERPLAPEVRESLLKEVEKERMMRVETERRLQDMQLESDSCRARLHALQEEFRKMEEMVANMLQYKAKIDQLKQENASMKSSYENNLQKYCSHISTLERDNMMLRNQVKKMEAQLHGKGDERDKSKLLLERLKMVEAENSSLVLENEQQRQQYEKCLDEIANQVVQALLAQKTLREECLKLQSRVQDLELQNKHLNIMFQQRMKFTSDSVLQVQHTSCITSHVCKTTASASATAAALSQGAMTLDFLDNAGSLQSMYSEIMGDDSPGKPQLSSPPPWLRDKVLAGPAGEDDTSPSSTTSSTSTASPTTPDAKEQIVQTKIETEFPATNSSPKIKHISVYERRTRSLERGSGGPFSWARRVTKAGNRSRRGSDSQEKSYFPLQKLKQSSSADAISHFGIGKKLSSSQTQLVADAIQWKKSSSQDRLTPQTLLQSLSKDDSPAVFMAGTDFNHKSFEAFNKSFEKLLAKNTAEEVAVTSTPSKPTSTSADTVASVASPALKAIKSSQSQQQQQQSPRRTPPQSSASQRLVMHQKSAPSPALRNPFADPLKSPKSPSTVPGQYYYYDYSDEDSDSRPVSRDFSTASTMSLNEILDSSMEGEVALDDDFFSDWSSVCISPKKRIDRLTGVTISNNAMESKLRAVSSSSSSRSRSTSSSPEASGIPVSGKLSADRSMKLKQGKLASGMDANQNITSGSTDVKAGQNLGPSNMTTSQASDSKMTEMSKSPTVSKTASQQAKTKILESSASAKPNSTQVQAEIHAEDKGANFLPSPSPSPNLSQKSQDLGYASKGSYSQSSPSPSPSMSHRGTPPWLHSTKDPSSFSRNELLTLVINREAMGASPRAASNNASPVQSPKLTRPGQLILAPQDKNFSFQGFSSASSTSSEDKSPLKIFESRHSADMKSSVIEVKKDGTFVHPLRSISDSTSDNSSSMSASPSSPVKSPSKIPPPVAKKPTRAVKPEARTPPSGDKDNSGKDPSKKYPGPANTNITVGFLLHTQVFPSQANPAVVEDFLKMSMADPKTKSGSLGQSHDHGSPFQTKCQSSDSSFENLRVERSGSKDDGYSTMSSDIHPEVLEKFSDTLTRKSSATDSEAHTGTVKGTASEVSTPNMEARRNSDPTLHTRDRSFDLTSDPDSALETSVHSTAEMVTSSSSQVSTSSSDYPLSPSSKVSQIARLFDGENTKLNFVHGTGASSQCKHKDSSLPSSPKASSTSSSPNSPNTFVPSCYQQPESPRRLANEFQKFNSSKPPGSPVPLKKDCPVSPKALNKSFGGFSRLPTKQQQQTSQQQSNGKPAPTMTRRFSDSSKPPSPPKAEKSETCTSNNSSPSPAGGKRLPKGFYSSVPQAIKNLSKPAASSSKSGKSSNSSNNEVKCDGSASEKKPKKACQNVRVTGQVLTEGAQNITAESKSKSQSTSKMKSVTESKDVRPVSGNSSKSNEVKSSKSQSTTYATSASNNNCPTQPSDLRNMQVKGEKSENNSKTTSSAMSNNKANQNGASCDNKNSGSVSRPESKTTGAKNNKKEISSSSKLSTPINQQTKQTSGNTTSQITQNPLNYQEDSTKPVANNDQSLTQSSPTTRTGSRIIMTNHAFQQISSDSENNEEDEMSSLPSVTFDDNFLEDIPEENDNGDGYIASNRRSINNANRSYLNSTTTNCQTAKLDHHQQQCQFPTSQQQSCFVLPSTASQSRTSQPSSDAHTYQSSTSNKLPHDAALQHNQFLAKLSHTATLPQSVGISNSYSAGSNNRQCLARSKSEHNLSNKPKSTSAYDDFFGMAWDSGKVLERSASVSEMDLLSQKPWLFEDCSDQSQSWEVSNKKACSYTLPAYLYNQQAGGPWTLLPPPPPPPPSASHYYNQQHQHQLHHQPHHQRHHQHSHFSPHHHHHQQQQHQHHHFNPLTQTLRLDLSDVTELDEDGSELASTRDSLDNSHLGMISDESPRLDCDEQKRFNSQFYSLCKVDSNRSLLSSGNESRERLSLTSLNEILNNKSFDKGGENGTPDSKDTEGASAAIMDEENEIAIREFDEISRQIASLSKTVDELNQSLSSLNSGEYEPSRLQQVVAVAECVARSEVIDGYHWVDDEFFLTSCNGEVIIGGSDLIAEDSFSDLFFQNNSFDLNSTEDATAEFYQVPVQDQHNPFAFRNSAGQDEIFAGSFFDTVREKPSLRQKKRQLLTRSDSDGKLNKKTPDAEKRLSVPVFHDTLNFGDGGKEGGGKSGRVMEGESSGSRLQGDEQTDILTGSNNDSDDSLASDIGLDHMMCQRLFGRKGRVQPATPGQSRPMVDFTKFFMRFGDSEKEAVAAFDFLNNFSLSESSARRRSSVKSNMSIEGSQTDAKDKESACGGEKEQPDTQGVSLAVSSENSQEAQSKETRDIGVDAMSQSQQSMNASFETFDQSITGLEAEESSSPPCQTVSHTDNTKASETETAIYQNRQDLDNSDGMGKLSIAAGGHRNTIDLSVPSSMEIVAQGGCDMTQLRSRSQSLKEKSTQNAINSVNTLTSYSDFVADLKNPPASSDVQNPPKLPPRRPIITNGSLYASLESEAPPLPPPPPCLRNTKPDPSDNHQRLPAPHQYHTQHHPHQDCQYHAPYVNHYVPPITFPHPPAHFNHRPLSDPFTSPHVSNSGNTPPPLPPRQPQISRTEDGRPQVLIRPHRIHQGQSKLPSARPHSFNHYLIDKSKAALSSTSPPSPLGTYPRPRSHSETSELNKQKTSSLEKSKDDSVASRIPRRKLKTRRERSKRKQNTERPCGDTAVKVGDGGSTGCRRQWRDIDVVNGKPLSDSSCEDNSSS